MFYKLLRILCIFVITIILTLYIHFPAYALSNGTCGDKISWTLDSDGTLTISGTGTMTDFSYYHHAPWYQEKDL